MDKSIYNHLKSITHKILDESNLKGYINLNPNMTEIDEIMRKDINN